MKKITILMMSLLAASSFVFAQTKAGKADTAQHTAYYTCQMHPDVVSLQPGKCPKCGIDLNLTSKEQMKASVTKSYTCPVHLDVSSHNPGKCPTMWEENESFSKRTNEGRSCEGLYLSDAS